eukprot:TRINITY_DN9223_c1_g1_i1.p1 TRINITY_DN9223_c1_g1~~TRINITY_DN9223_c1_g1_i1.p1  ORF type:complete len:403 (-),score=52.41 TRINITY_DN9223_c1_g1_i1:308-1423(-)
MGGDKQDSVSRGSTPRSLRNSWSPISFLSRSCSSAEGGKSRQQRTQLQKQQTSPSAIAQQSAMQRRGAAEEPPSARRRSPIPGDPLAETPGPVAPKQSQRFWQRYGGGRGGSAIGRQASGQTSLPQQQPMSASADLPTLQNVNDASHQPAEAADESRRIDGGTAHPKGMAAAELCCFCFQVLLAHLRGMPAPPYPLAADPLMKAPLFVTWLKQRPGERSEICEPELRGCIGCLEPVSFRPGLSEYVLRSSLHDRRFPPVMLEEVPTLICRLSILYQFEDCSYVYDWSIGLHGVLINFTDAQQRNYSATYLPEVAREHGMSHNSAIRELVVKSGYTGPCDQGLLSRMHVKRYQTLVKSVSYPEFLRAESASA